MVKKVFKLILILFMLALFVFLLISLEPIRILSMLGQVNASFLVMILITNLLALIFFFLAWHVILLKVTPVSIRENFIATALSIFFNLTIPFFSLSGEISRIRYLNNKCNISNDILIAALSINKFQYGLAMLIFLSLGVILMYYYGLDVNLLSYYFSITIFLNILLLIIILYPQIIKKFLKNILFLLIYFKKVDNNNFEYFYNKISKFIDNFSYHIKVILRSPSHLLALFLVSIQWFFNTLSFYLAFLSLGMTVNLGVVLFTFPILAFLTTTSLIIPANIGLVEPLMILIYASFGIDVTTSFVAILIARGIIILEDLAITFPLAMKYGGGLIEKPFE